MADGIYLNWGHICSTPVDRDEPPGTLWQCPACPRIWCCDEKDWFTVAPWRRPWLRWYHRNHHRPVPPAPVSNEEKASDGVDHRP